MLMRLMSEAQGIYSKNIHSKLMWIWTRWYSWAFLVYFHQAFGWHIWSQQISFHWNVHWRGMQSVGSVTYISQGTVPFSHINYIMWLYWNKPNLQTTSDTAGFGALVGGGVLILWLFWGGVWHNCIPTLSGKDWIIIKKKIFSMFLTQLY